MIEAGAIIYIDPKYEVVFIGSSNVSVCFKVTVTDRLLFYLLIEYMYRLQVILDSVTVHYWVLQDKISQLNGIKHIQKDIVCSSEDCQSSTINYTVSNIHPLMMYIFIVDTLDYLNNSKTKNESNFSEYKVLN